MSLDLLRIFDLLAALRMEESFSRLLEQQEDFEQIKVQLCSIALKILL